jgi:hypothetical protein
MAINAMRRAELREEWGRATPDLMRLLAAVVSTGEEYAHIDGHATRAINLYRSMLRIIDEKIEAGVDVAGG